VLHCSHAKISKNTACHFTVVPGSMHGSVFMMRKKKKRGYTVCSRRRAWPACSADLARAAMHVKRRLFQGTAAAHKIASCSSPSYSCCHTAARGCTQIMGLGYAQNTTHWSRGFYVNGNNVSRPWHCSVYSALQAALLQQPDADSGVGI
jgi:hypothetical protein